MYINPYSKLEKGKWMKANFHTHAGTGPDTCGAYDLEKVIKLYKEAGYDILTISNHDLYTDTSELKDKYDIGLINGFEYSQDNHMLCIRCNEFIEGGHQSVIDECINQDGFIILCHPNWQHKEYWPREDIDLLKKYTGIEVFNSVIGRMSGTGLAEDIWDYLLSQGKIVWGFGNDDFHRWYDLNKSWSMIHAKSRDEEDVKSAIKKGSFYLSSGLYLDKFVFADNKIKIKASEKGFADDEYEYIFFGEKGKLLKKEINKTSEYTLIGDEAYVRIKVMGKQGYTLWTQPIYKQELFTRP